MFFAALALGALCGYLLGSINTAILLCRIIYKQDVRELGSGNAGMTNVARNFGRKGAVATLAGDMLKGVAAVFIGRLWLLWLAPGADAQYGAYIAAIFTIVGHMFPVFFGFKGGKGVATAGGVILAIQPIVAIILIGTFLLIFAVSKMVSLSSIIAISLYPVATVVYGVLARGAHLAFSVVCAAVIAALVVWMHRENIKRIKSGTEYKFGQKKKGDNKK